MAKPSNNETPESLASIRELLSCDPADGSLIWRARVGNDASTARWNGRYAGSTAGHVKTNGYREVRALGRKWRAHRIVWALHFGHWPAGVIDHINGARSDNRISNLRDVTKHENQRNRARNRSKLEDLPLGVVRNAVGFQAHIRVGGQLIYLGSYASVAEAAAARSRADLEHNFASGHGRILPR